MSQITILNYQGNKASLMPFISEHIYKYVQQGDKICDLFSGSGSVGSFFKKDFDIISNDAEIYSTIISSALLNMPKKSLLIEMKDIFINGFKLNKKQLTKKYEEIISIERVLLTKSDTYSLIDIYSDFPTIWNDKDITPDILKKRNEYNLFLHYYAGTYFGIEQSIDIDAIIKTINEIELTETKNVLFSCLFYAMKETVFSKDGHMAQPLNIEKNVIRHIKQRKKEILFYFLNKLEEFISKSSNENINQNHKIYNLDMTVLLKERSFTDQKINLIYADPPYTDMQYSRYYHLLNIAVKYNYPQPTIIGGNFTNGLYTEGRNQSDLSKKSTAKNKIQDLYNYCKNNDITLVLSYAYPKDKINQKSDRYTISIEDLVNMAKETFGNSKVQIEELNYRHANHRNSTTKEVIEYLIICGKERQKSNFDLVDVKSKLKELVPTSKNPIYNTHLYWSQKSFNVIDLLIEKLSVDGDIIFDPFMGSGVTIIQSTQKKMNRIGIGCDVNEMSSFIIKNIFNDIPTTNLKKLFGMLNEYLTKLKYYYETICPKCYGTANISKVVFDKPSRTINDFHIKAISYTCPNCGKSVKDADESDMIKLSTSACIDFVPNLSLIPNSKIAVGDFDRISDIFTPRNFSVLNELVGYINKSEDSNILKYLLMSVLHLSKITDTHSNSQWPLWIPKVNCVEKNIIDLLQKRMKNLLLAQEFIQKNYSTTQISHNFNELKPSDALVLTKGSQYITNSEIPDDSVSLIITDPPYMDQVLYSEYMQLYKPFININFNIEDEIIVSASPKRNKNKDEYFKLLSDVFKMCKSKLKENHIMCLFFHDSNLDVWVRLLDILETNGFKFISQEHIKKSKTIKNILSPKKSLSGDAILFFENTRTPLKQSATSLTSEEIKISVYKEARKMLEKYGDLSTPELYDLGLMEMLIENGWLVQLSKKYKSLVEIFEEYFIWKRDSSKWHLQE